MSSILGSIVGWFGGVSSASSAQSVSPATASAASAAAPKKQISRTGLVVLTTRDVMGLTGQYLYVKEIIALFSVNKKLYAQYLDKNMPLPQFWGPIARRFSVYPKRENLDPTDLKLLEGILKEDKAALKAFQEQQEELSKYGISLALTAFVEPRSWIRNHFARSFSHVSSKTFPLLGGKEGLLLASVVSGYIHMTNEKLRPFVDAAGLDGLQAVQKDPFVEEARQKLLSSPILLVTQSGCADRTVIDLVIRVERIWKAERKEILIYLIASDGKVTYIFANFLSREVGPSFEKGNGQNDPQQQCPVSTGYLYGRSIPGRSFPENLSGSNRQSLVSWVKELMNGQEVFFFPYQSSKNRSQENWIESIQTTDVTFRLGRTKSAGTASATTAASSAASK